MACARKWQSDQRRDAALADSDAAGQVRERRPRPIGNVLGRGITVDVDGRERPHCAAVYGWKGYDPDVVGPAIEHEPVGIRIRPWEAGR